MPNSPPSESERIYTALQFYENWKKLRIKYDPRHWMGNWFLMAASKTSPLFKYFCCATADAMFKVCEGERERVAIELGATFASDPYCQAAYDAVRSFNRDRG